MIFPRSATQQAHGGLSAFNLDEADLRSRFIDPYERAEPITWYGRTLDGGDVHRIQISETADPLDEEAARESYQVFGTFNSGADVTNYWITRPPGSLRVANQADSLGTARRVTAAAQGTTVFIGHGGSLLWRELKDFISDRLGLPWEEFNRVSVAGVTNITRLSEMLDATGIAFVVLTAEDEHATGEVVARQNVVHEAGLFQGRLGFKRAIVLLEEGCAEFSNIEGLVHIHFPKGNVGAAFEEVRRVLEREGFVDS